MLIKIRRCHYRCGGQAIEDVAATIRAGGESGAVSFEDNFVDDRCCFVSPIRAVIGANPQAALAVNPNRIWRRRMNGNARDDDIRRIESRGRKICPVRTCVGRMPQTFTARACPDFIIVARLNR